MFDEMYDIASQLVAKWARFGPKEKINVTEDFTRLTLDSIALYVERRLRMSPQLTSADVPWIHDLTASTMKNYTHL